MRVGAWAPHGRQPFYGENLEVQRAVCSSGLHGLSQTCSTGVRSQGVRGDVWGGVPDLRPALEGWQDQGSVESVFT